MSERLVKGGHTNQTLILCYGKTAKDIFVAETVQSSTR